MQYSICAHYTITDNAAVGTVQIGLTYSYVDDQCQTFAQLTRTSVATGGAPSLVPAHELVNMNINWNGISGSPVHLSIFGANILDQEYIQTSNERVSSGFNSNKYGAPAMFGAGPRYNLGG